MAKCEVQKFEHAPGCATTHCRIWKVTRKDGVVFGFTDHDLDIEFENTKIAGTKSGRAEVTSVLGLFSFGDASSTTAAANGGITTIDHADYEHFNILGIFQKTTVVVYGN